MSYAVVFKNPREMTDQELNEVVRRNQWFGVMTSYSYLPRDLLDELWRRAAERRAKDFELSI